MARHRIFFTRALVEIAFIIFLFYSNLLMGEFTRSSPANMTWELAFVTIFTLKNFGIALVSAIVGFIGFETLRNKV